MWKQPAESSQPAQRLLIVVVALSFAWALLVLSLAADGGRDMLVFAMSFGFIAAAIGGEGIWRARAEVSSSRTWVFPSLVGASALAAVTAFTIGSVLWLTWS